MRNPNHAHSITQEIDMTHQQIVAGALQQIDRKTIGAARMPGASVIGHCGNLA